MCSVCKNNHINRAHRKGRAHAVLCLMSILAVNRAQRPCALFIHVLCFVMVCSVLRCSVFVGCALFSSPDLRSVFVMVCSVYVRCCALFMCSAALCLSQKQSAGQVKKTERSPQKQSAVKTEHTITKTNHHKQSTADQKQSAELRSVCT